MIGMYGNSKAANAGNMVLTGSESDTASNAARAAVDPAAVGGLVESVSSGIASIFQATQKPASMYPGNTTAPVTPGIPAQTMPMPMVQQPSGMPGWMLPAALGVFALAGVYALTRK